MGLLRTQIRMEKKKTRARLENRRRKWVTRNMFSTSSWIPIMILKKGEIWGKYSKRCSSWQTGWILPEDSAAVAAPDTRPRLYTLVCFANNKQWDFFFFPNTM